MSVTSISRKKDSTAPTLGTWLFPIGTPGHLTGAHAEKKLSSIFIGLAAVIKSDPSISGQISDVGTANVNGNTYLAATCTLTVASAIASKMPPQAKARVLQSSAAVQPAAPMVP